MILVYSLCWMFAGASMGSIGTYAIKGFRIQQRIQRDRASV